MESGWVDPPVLVDVEKVSQMRAEGLSIRQVAEVVGLSKSTVSRLL